MCLLKFKYVLTNLVIQSLLLNCQSVKRARRYYNFDYDFRDWDNATQIELDYTLDLNVDGYNETNTLNLLITENTEHTEDTTPGILVDSKENTTNTVETIINQTESNRPTNVTVNPQPTNVTVTTVDPLNREPVNVTKGDPLLGPEVTADQIGNASISTPIIMTFPDIYETRSQSTWDIFLETDMAHHSTLPTPNSGIILEAHEEMTAKHTGYLTTFLLEVFKVMAAKNTTDAAKLFAALEAEVTELDKADRFHGFGKSTIAAFIMLVKLIKGVEPDVVQKQAARGHFLLSNRTVNLPGEVVIVMDLADDVYQYEEGERILATLEDIDKFPNTVESDREIAHEVMEAVVLAPFMRIYGSAQEKFLVKKLEQAIVKDFFHGVTFDRNQNDSVFRSSFKRKKYLKAYPKQNEIKLVKPNSPVSLSKIFTISRNSKTVNNFKAKRKTKYWRTSQWRTKNIKPTEKSKRSTKKQKIMIKKYLKNKLNTQKIKKVNNSMIKRKTIIGNKYSKKKKYNKIRNKEEDKGFSNFFISRYTTDLEIEKFQVPKNMKEQLQSTDEEEIEDKFKANIDDAFFHANEPTFRSRISHHKRDFDRRNHETSSFSDEENIIKSKLYKALGYDNNFAEVFKSHYRRRLK